MQKMTSILPIRFVCGAGEENIAPARLDAAIMASAGAAGLSRARIQNAVEQGQICVNGARVTKTGKKLKPGDIIEGNIEIDEDSAIPEPQDGIKFDIVYEDSHIIVIDKPPGLVVHPGAGHKDKTLVNGLLAKYPELRSVGSPDRPGIVHRLDAETSGLLVAARSQAAYEALAAMFARHGVSRQYWAIVKTSNLPDAGRFDTPYGRNPQNRFKYTSLENRFKDAAGAAKRAVTHFRVMARAPGGCALVSCLLETGRTHQIRVHLSEHGAPILGDALYAPKDVALNRAIARCALHARKLSFAHPVSGDPMCFCAPWPKDFADAAQKLWQCNILTPDIEKDWMPFA